jgi:glucokinase
MVRTHPAKPEGMRDAAHLRRLNLERVLAAAIARDGAFTRGELIAVTGLSAPTIGSLAGQLIRSGLLTDLGTGPSRGGRRPARMEFNSRHGFVAGVDLGPTRTRIGLADLRGEIITRQIVATPQDSDPVALLQRLAEDVRALMRQTDVPPARLVAVGAGAPGAVDPTHGTVMALAPNLKGWAGVPMGAILRDALGAPVVVENDVNLAVLGEHWKGAARGHDTCAFLSFGTGIGAGLMVKGELHHGAHFLAGEVGLMCMGPQFAGTKYGSRGCLETLIGLGTLKTRWTPAESAASSDWVCEFFSAVNAGDPEARPVAEETAILIGIAAANLCSVLDPSLIVLGGALIAQGEQLVADARRIVGQIIPTPPAVVATSLDKDAPLFGCLLVATNEAREQLRSRLGDRG